MIGSLRNSGELAEGQLPRDYELEFAVLENRLEVCDGRFRPGGALRRESLTVVNLQLSAVAPFPEARRWVGRRGGTATCTASKKTLAGAFYSCQKPAACAK